MGPTIKFRQLISRGLRFITGKTRKILPGVSKSPLSLGDKILADAVMLAAIPSPTQREELRAQFVLDRLALLGVEKSIDSHGNILVRLYSAGQPDKGPFLFFTDLGTNRWHSVHSLSQLDASTAKGAGLADVLGTASLLSLIEGIICGRIAPNTDIMFLFSAYSFDDPKIDAFDFILNHDMDRPSAALGIQGFSLGAIINRPQGNYQLEIKVVSPVQNDDSEDPGKKKNGVTHSDNPVIDVLITLAKNLSDLDLGYDNSTHCYVRRIEGGAGFGAVSSEGIIDVEIDSDDASYLDKALKAVEAAVEAVQQETECTLGIKIISHIPAGVSLVNDNLITQVVNIMKDLHIKVKEKTGADPAAFLLNSGIPTMSLGVARGRVGLENDVIDIASMEKGRQLLEEIIGKLFREQP